MDEMVSVASKLSVDEMKQMLIENVNNFEIDTMVFKAILDALELKIGEQEYCKFVIELDSLMV